MSEAKARNNRRTVIGTVVSTKSRKTIGVERERRFMHPLYGKIVKRHKVLKAHDEQELAVEGDRVEIVDPIETARNQIAHLRDEGADLIVALTHLGFSGDVELAESVDGIDVIIGGHSHTRRERPEIVRRPVEDRAGSHGTIEEYEVG